MTTRVQVMCIRKRGSHHNPHERIEGIGGVHNAKAWYMLEEMAIASIESKEFAFFVRAGGREVDVIIAKHNGRKYLKTVPDGYAPDNLLSLPECPK